MRLARTLKAGALALIVVALFAPIASAGSMAVPAPESSMAVAHTFAVQRWGMEPCGGNVAVSWARLGPNVNAHSYWLAEAGADPSTYTDCSITYSLDVAWDWPKLCTVIEHELGHLAGHEHSTDPHNIMSVYYVFPAPECAAPIKGAGPLLAPSRGRSIRARVRHAMTLAWGTKMPHAI